MFEGTNAPSKQKSTEKYEHAPLSSAFSHQCFCFRSTKETLMGAIFLAAVAVLPIILGNLTGMSIQLGGTSLLIVVGVALDTTRSLDSFMTMRNHKGFLG